MLRYVWTSFRKESKGGKDRGPRLPLLRFRGDKHAKHTEKPNRIAEKKKAIDEANNDRFRPRLSAFEPEMARLPAVFYLPGMQLCAGCKVWQ